MNNVLAITPVLKGTIVAPLGIDMPRLISEFDTVSRVREENINVNRARLQDIFLRRYFGKYEFVLLVDSDVSIKPGSLEALMSAWRPGTAPCINTKGFEGPHVVTACALVHRLDYKDVKYLDKPGECQCLKLPNPFYVDGVEGTETR